MCCVSICVSICVSMCVLCEFLCVSLSLSLSVSIEFVWRVAATGWRRLMGSLIFIGHFPQK